MVADRLQVILADAESFLQGVVCDPPESHDVAAKFSMRFRKQGRNRWRILLLVKPARIISFSVRPSIAVQVCPYLLPALIRC